MKTKPHGTAPGICRELTCERPWTSFGYCDEHRAELNRGLERGAETLKELTANMKTVTLAEMLTDVQLDQCIKLYPDRLAIRDAVIVPNLGDINRRLGQENDPDYLSYAIVYAIETASRRSAS